MISRLLRTIQSYVNLCRCGKLDRGRHSVESECFQKGGECRARRRDPGSASGGRRKRVHLCRDCGAWRRDPRSAGGGRHKRVRLCRDRGTQKCDTGSGLDGGGRVRSGRGIRFHALPRSLSSGVWVIVNTTALALDNADTPCCESALLGRTRAVRRLLGDAHLFSGLRP